MLVEPLNGYKSVLLSASICSFSPSNELSMCVDVPAVRNLVVRMKCSSMGKTDVSKLFCGNLQLCH